MNNKVKQLQGDVATKSTEIANLDVVIAKQDNDLKAYKKVIEKQKTQINKHKETISKQKKKLVTISRGSNRVYKKVNVVATAYIAMCNTGCTGFTATGLDVRNTPSKRVVAVDPNVIPLHSKVRVNLPSGESFLATALDTGGDIQNGRIDVLMATKSEAIEFGRQENVTVEILK